MIPGYLRTPSETMQVHLGGPEIRPGIESSGCGGNHSKVTSYLRHVPAFLEALELFLGSCLDRSP